MTGSDPAYMDDEDDEEDFDDDGYACTHCGGDGIAMLMILCGTTATSSAMAPARIVEERG